MVGLPSLGPGPIGQVRVTAFAAPGLASILPAGLPKSRSRRAARNARIIMYQKTLDRGEKFTAAGNLRFSRMSHEPSRGIVLQPTGCGDARRDLLLELRRHREGVVEAVADREQP